MVGQVPWVTLDRKSYRIFWNCVGLLVLSEPASNLPPIPSARRIIRNLFITLAALVSPTHLRRYQTLRLPSSLFDLQMSYARHIRVSLTRPRQIANECVILVLSCLDRSTQRS